MARAIDSEAAYRFLSEQLVKETGAFSKGVNKGLNIARSAMRNPDAIPTLTPPNEPLTLDELREMNGKPVWIENLEEPEKSQWRLCHWDRRKYLVLQGISVGGYLVEEYGEAWIAYAYHPVHIDREKWEPCHSCDSKCLICMVNETHKCRICKDYKYYLPLYQFCPKCGRPLTDQAWAELEKRLRGMMA